MERQVTTVSLDSFESLQVPVGTSHNRKLGMIGEHFAVQYLNKAGVQILSKNYRCQFGEIDIIACEARVLVAVEVKCRALHLQQWYDPIDGITAEKRERLNRLSRVVWHLRHQLFAAYDFEEIRVDGIGVVFCDLPIGGSTLTHWRDILSPF